MSSALDFHPIRLQRARELIEKAHPGTAAQPNEVDPSTLATLRSAVEEARNDETRLVLLAGRLSPRQVRGLVTGLEQWEELRTSVLILLRRRGHARLLPIVWSAWQRHPTVAELRGLLLEFGERFGWAGTVAGPYVGLVPFWIASERPGVAIQEWLDEQGLSWSDLDGLVDRPIRPDSSLGRLIRISVMVGGSRHQLQEEAKHLREWHEELDPEQRIQFGQNYLTNLGDRLWDRALLDRFRDTYGLPKKPRLERFWDPVPADVRERFQRLFIEEAIRDAFKWDVHKDREKFWKGWAGKIVDVDGKTAGEVHYYYIEFEDFVVFEFLETGHAAYFYLPPDGARMRRVRPSHPRDLKIKKTSLDKGYRFVDRDNRLIHNPPWGWHPRGQEMVRRWLLHLA